MNQVKILLTAVIVSAFLVSAVSAHDCFKDPFTEYYGFKSVSCKTCHPDSKKQTHNRFGIMYVNELKGLDLTKKWKALEGKEEERAKFEEEMVKEFKKILPNVEGNQMTMKALLAAGIINGTRLDKAAGGADPGAVTLKEYEEELAEAEKAAKAKKEKEMKEMMEKMKKDGKQGVVAPLISSASGTTGLGVLSGLALIGLLILAMASIGFLLLRPRKTFVTA